MSSAKMKKVKKCAALDKQHSDAEKRQRGRRREQDNKECVYLMLYESTGHFTSCNLVLN